MINVQAMQTGARFNLSGMETGQIEAIIPTGSTWESYVLFHTEHKPSYDGLVMIASHDERTTFLTHGMDHKNMGYASRLLGKRSQWTFVCGRNGFPDRLFRETDSGDCIFFIRVPVHEWNKRSPKRLPVCERYACEHKHGPIADGFPANYR